MATVHTEFGPGEIIASETVRGRTQHKIAVNGNQIWVDEAKLGITRVADAFAWTPPGHHPDAPADQFSHLGDEDPEYYREQGYGHDEQANYEADPAYQQHIHGDEFGGGGQDGGGWSGLKPWHGDWQGMMSPDSSGNHGNYIQSDYRQAWAPVDHDNSVNLPYDPTPQYPAIPGDTESTLQPIHQIDADERLSPADSITFEDREEPEAGEGVGMFEDNFAKAAGWQQDPEQGRGVSPYGGGNSQYPGGLEPDRDMRHEQYMNDNQGQVWEHESPYYQGEHPSQDYLDANPEGGTGPLPGPGQQASPYDYPQYGPGSGRDFQGGMVHNAFAFLIPLAEGLMGAGAGAAASGAAADAGAGMAGQAVARGVGSGAAHMMSGGGDQGGEGGGDPLQQAVDYTSPGEGWGELQRGAALTDWLASRETPSAGIGAGLSDKYIDITSGLNYHEDPVAQFRHDPGAFISRIGHVLDEPVSPEMEHYGQLVESNPQIREAAWNDVRAKAMRLRREGRVAVKDVDTDRIYASVEGDHGTYDVMIAKGGAFGGFGGGHTITNWRCACEWGRWAFKRQMTYVGRLCSHAYASYLEMQSAHMKNQPRQRRLTRPQYKRSDALQSVPQRLVPELVVNDLEDAQQFIDVEKDERKDVGPDDIVSETDIVHFARVMTACERNNWPYPRELLAFLEHLGGEDQTPDDWKIEDAGNAAGSALNEIRDWADTPPVEDLGHMEQRNDDVRDAVEKARDGGTDASQLVAFRTAAPQDESMFGGGYRPPAEATAPSGSREPEGSNPHQFAPSDTSGTVSQEQGVAGVGSSSAPGARTVTPDAPAGGSMFGPAIGGGQQPATPSIFGPGASGQPGAGAPPPGGAAGAGATYAPGAPATSGWSHPGGAAGVGGGAQQPTPGAGGAGGAAPGGNGIGQGDYKIQSGDTLSDIAQRSGYGGDYNSLAQQNQIADPNKINAGDTINIGKPGGGGEGGKAGGGMEWGGGAKGPQATDNPSTNAPGGPLNQNSGGPGADASAASNPTNDLTNPGLTTPGANPAQTGSNPATPGAGNPATTQVDTGAAGGSSGGGGVDTNAVGGGGGGSKTDTSTSNAGAGSASSDSGGGGLTEKPTDDVSSNVANNLSNIGGLASDLISKFTNVQGGKYAIFADQADYDEWQKFAYPDIGPGSHQPFAGSGPMPPLEFSTSEEYADKARKTHDDVTDLEKHNVVEGDLHTGGIKRAGQGAHRHVEPIVVREQKPQGGGRQTIAHAPEFDDFDPLAPRTAASFDDPYQPADAEAVAVRTAAAGGDIVADFQRNYGAEIMSSNSSSAQDNFDIAGAAAGFLQKTAGRNYSLAEQAELIREGDIGGAGNLDQLQLAGTHYQDESKNSVGLW